VTLYRHILCLIHCNAKNTTKLKNSTVFTLLSVFSMIIPACWKKRPWHFIHQPQGDPWVNSFKSLYLRSRSSELIAVFCKSPCISMAVPPVSSKNKLAHSKEDWSDHFYITWPLLHGSEYFFQFQTVQYGPEHPKSWNAQKNKGPFSIFFSTFFHCVSKFMFRPFGAIGYVIYSKKTKGHLTALCKKNTGPLLLSS